MIKALFNNKVIILYCMFFFKHKSVFQYFMHAVHSFIKYSLVVFNIKNKLYLHVLST